MIVDIVDKYCTDDNNPIKNLRLKLAPSAVIAASVGLRHLIYQWGVWPASPTPLTRFIDWRPSVGCTLGPHIELHRFAALKRAAVGSRMSLRSIKSKVWDGSVRAKIAKGHFVQGMQHPRIFGRGHIGWGWTNIAPSQNSHPLHSTSFIFRSYSTLIWKTDSFCQTCGSSKSTKIRSITQKVSINLLLFTE
jgi:hypothetical protein